MSHIKSLVAPKSWVIQRKKEKFVARPNPGPHPIKRAWPLIIVVRDVLKLARFTREAKKILNENKIKIDGKIRKDPRFPVGLMDVIEVVDLKQYFRVLLDRKGRLIIHAIKKEEAHIKPRKIIGKTKIRKGKYQMNFSDGFNELKGDKKYDVYDTIVFDLSKNNIIDHLKLEKGAMCYIVDGKQIGRVGILKEIINEEGFQKMKIIFSSDNKDFKTLKNYVFIIGKDKPVISLPK